MLTAVLAGAAAAPLAAQPAASLLEQRVWLRLSQQQANADSVFRIDDSEIGLRGTDLALESDLGLPERRPVRSVLFGVRLGERWRAEVEHFSLKRDRKDFRITRTLRVDDTEFEAEALLQTRLDSKVTRASIGYSFWHSPEFEAGAVLGVHSTRFSFDISGTASAQGQTSAVLAESADDTVPLPTVGVYAAWALASWTLSTRADFFSIRHRGYDGRMVHAQAMALYRLSPHVSLGGGYRITDYRVDANRRSFTGGLDYRFRGPELMLELGF